MAVFTEVTADQARAFIAPLGVGELRSLRGITAGIENTNYFVTTERGEYVLTLFERLTFEQLPFYLRLMQHLARRGIAVPEPRGDASGEILFELNGKPATLVDKLAGAHQLAPDAHHCQQVGAALARMHLAGLDFPLSQPNLRGLAWWTETVPEVLPHVSDEQRRLLTEELAYQQALGASAACQALPRGPIHADLFRDNVMFLSAPLPQEGEKAAGSEQVVEAMHGREKLSGFFDFYFAGVDSFLFDIAVCLNDWCIDLDSGRLVEERASAFVRAYAGERPLDSGEQRLLPAMLRAAAFRFWLSRLWDFHLPREASMLKAHDPSHFERVLRERIERPWHPAWGG
jgi:homoserine kinase type II